MKIYSIAIEPSYHKPNGTFVLPIDKLKEKIPFEIKESSMIYIPSTAFGGNHKHPRQEAFITLGSDLEIIWEDDNKEIHREFMMKEKELKIYIIEPHVPHVIVNRSTTHAMTLIEYADGPQRDVVRMDLLHR